MQKGKKKGGGEQEEENLLSGLMCRDRNTPILRPNPTRFGICYLSLDIINIFHDIIDVASLFL
jgi:hypothetical protein